MEKTEIIEILKHPWQTPSGKLQDACFEAANLIEDLSMSDFERADKLKFENLCEEIRKQTK